MRTSSSLVHVKPSVNGHDYVHENDQAKTRWDAFPIGTVKEKKERPNRKRSANAVYLQSNGSTTPVLSREYDRDCIWQQAFEVCESLGCGQPFKDVA